MSREKAAHRPPPRQRRRACALASRARSLPGHGGRALARPGPLQLHARRRRSAVRRPQAARGHVHRQGRDHRAAHVPPGCGAERALVVAPPRARRPAGRPGACHHRHEHRLARDRPRLPEGGRGRRLVLPGRDGRDSRRAGLEDRRGARDLRAERRARDRADDGAPAGPVRRRGYRAARHGRRAGADARLVVSRHRLRGRHDRDRGRLEARRPLARLGLRIACRGRALARRRTRRRGVGAGRRRLGARGLALPRRPLVARRRDAPARRPVRPARTARPGLSPRRDRLLHEPGRVRRGRGAPRGRALPATPAPPARLDGRLPRPRRERRLRAGVGPDHPRRVQPGRDGRRRRQQRRGRLQARLDRSPAPGAPGRGHRRPGERAPARRRGRARRTRPAADAVRRLLGVPGGDEAGVPRRLVRDRGHRDRRPGGLLLVRRAEHGHDHQQGRALRTARERARPARPRCRRPRLGRRRSRPRARRPVRARVRRPRRAVPGLGAAGGRASPGGQPGPSRPRRPARDRVRRRAADGAGRQGPPARAARAARRRPIALGSPADDGRRAGA